MKSKSLEEMEHDFEKLYNNSAHKDMLLKDEIDGYSLIFDKTKLPLTELSNKDKPLRSYEILYSSQQIFLIREFHRRHNVRNSDISKMYTDDWDSWTMHIYNSAWGGFLEPNALTEPYGPKYYIEFAEKLSKYLEWLKDKAKSPKRNEKEYKSLTRARAFYIGLLQECGKRNFLHESIIMKTEMIQFVKETWEGQSGKTVYEEVLQILSVNNPINKNYKEKHLTDFNYGYKLFKDRYPD